jgi:hypothetical protein
MRFERWITAAALALLAPSVAFAATEANFNANTTGDLVELCGATPDNGLGTAAVNFARLAAMPGLAPGSVPAPA